MTAINAKLMEPVSVKDFGATGLGQENDAPAIQAAIDAASDIYFPPGNYLVQTSINLTNRADGPMHIHGSSWGKGQGAVIIGDTGMHAAIDCTGSQYLSFRDFSVISTPSGLATPSQCGFLFSRSADSGYSQFNTLERIRVDIKTNPGAYGGRGSVGIYNASAEIMGIHDCYLMADTSLVLTQCDANQWNMDSLYAPISDVYGGSMSMVTVDGATTFHSYDVVGQCLFAYNLWCSEFKNIYLTGVAGAGRAIRLENCLNVGITCLSELNRRTLEFIASGTNIRVRLEGGASDLSPFVADMTPAWVGLVDCTLEHLSVATPTFEYFYDSPYTNTNMGCHFIANYRPSVWTGLGSTSHDNKFTTRGITASPGDTSSPADGPYPVAALRWNSAPASGLPPGWVCTSRVDTHIHTQVPLAVDCTFDDATDVVQKVAHGLANGKAIMFHTLVNTTGIVIDTIYYVLNATADAFQVEASIGGGVVPITEAGEGSGTYGEASINVDTTANMEAGDVIGIVLDDGTVHWTSIITVTDIAFLVIAAAIPAARYAKVGAAVYTNRWAAMANLA